MPPAAFPSNELERLQAVRRHLPSVEDLGVTLDRITGVARQLVDTPIAAITLVDVDRQWLVSSAGLDLRHAPRDHAFCAHTILGGGALQVPDTTRDHRFHDNPLVTGAPGIAAYLGVPLTTADDYNLGALCAIDLEPRRFGDDDERVLRDLAVVVVDLFETHRRELAQAITRRTPALATTDRGF